MDTPKSSRDFVRDRRKNLQNVKRRNYPFWMPGVVQSRSPTSEPGEIVRAMTGWCSLAAMDASKSVMSRRMATRLRPNEGLLDLPGPTQTYEGM